MKGIKKIEKIKNTGEIEEIEVKKIEEMKGTRKTDTGRMNKNQNSIDGANMHKSDILLRWEEVKDIGETKELEKSENLKERLENIAYLAKGGFGTYEFGKQVVWNKNGKQNVCLKSFSNLTNKIDFLQKIKNQLKLRDKNAIAIYGITKNPTENEYMMVMDYAIYGLMHKDFHSGNIVNQTLTLSYITDFGLCKLVTENNPENIYGVILYMVPETLSRGEYTQASDIYSFGMVMLKVLTSYQLYYNISHDATLGKDICEGLKPEIKCKIPKFLKEIIEKCWNFEPLNRPTYTCRQN
ncbi:hypothetical protein Glove_276g110 [Diversispora epigaea]|uniref:Protein kinase domain-containing protein n=1 Tax=Diversispora epigaea TaxID=1348612 RepID=A0A397I4V1_9GLOM|nr:hypothetical protein Glove_276g110 [Diversispora epigaea]